MLKNDTSGQWGISTPVGHQVRALLEEAMVDEAGTICRELTENSAGNSTLVWRGCHEFINGNENYKKYFEEYDIIISEFCLIELFYILFKDFDLETARKYFKEFKPFCISVPEIVIEKAMLFKLRNKKKDLSYVDCIGYELAKFNNLKFLTGDEEFKNLENVEFVK